MRATGSELTRALYGMGFRFMVAKSGLFVIDPYGRTMSCMVGDESGVAEIESRWLKYLRAREALERIGVL